MPEISAGHIKEFWSLNPAALFARLATSPSGLTEAEARKRLRQTGRNSLKPAKKYKAFKILQGIIIYSH